jgi:tetratricopeptide (TPR) repeat protein
MKTAPENIDAIIGAAYALQDLKQMVESTKMYELAIKLSKGKNLPGPPGDVYYNLANAYYFGPKEIDLSITYYKKSVELNPDRSECLYNLGNAYCQRFLYLDAKESYKRALGANTDSSIELNIEYNLANTEFLTECYQEAINRYEKVLAVQTDNEEGMYNLAKSYFKTDRLEEAKSLFERCIELNQDNVDAMLGLAKVY